MSERSLTAVVLLQSLVLLVLVADRFVPEAHAQSVVRCEVANWPDVMKGIGSAAMRVKVEELPQPVKVQVDDWNTSDTVKVVVEDWNTSDEVRVGVSDWATSDTVTVRMQ